MTQKQITRAWIAIYSKRRQAAKKLKIEPNELCADINRIHHITERGLITTREAAILCKELADSAIAAKEEYEHNPVDSKCEQLELEIPVYLFAAAALYS